MSYQYERETARRFAEHAKALGFRAFLAESGHYGYITDEDAQRVMSFGVDFGSIKLSGNYRASRLTGSGWEIERDIGAESLTRDEMAGYLHAPTWVRDATPYVTEAEYRATYQKSSNFTQV